MPGQEIERWRQERAGEKARASRKGGRKLAIEQAKAVISLSLCTCTHVRTSTFFVFRMGLSFVYSSREGRKPGVFVNPRFCRERIKSYYRKYTMML